MHAFENNPILAYKKGEVSPTSEILFTPCAAAESLLEALNMATRNAATEDLPLFLTACLSFDKFRNHQHRGGSLSCGPRTVGALCFNTTRKNIEPNTAIDLLRGFSEEKTPARKTKHKHLTRKDAQQRQ
jgi:hypothetical protein